MSKIRGLKQPQQDFKDNYINLKQTASTFTSMDFAPRDLKCLEMVEEFRDRTDQTRSSCRKKYIKNMMERV
jgi:hypothetical protein